MRPTEVRAVEALLSQEHDDVTELSKLVITTLDELRKTRQQYVVGARYPRGEGRPGQTMIYGPYSTPHQANKTGEKLVAPSAGGSWGVYQLYREVNDGT